MDQHDYTCPENNHNDNDNNNDHNDNLGDYLCTADPILPHPSPQILTHHHQQLLSILHISTGNFDSPGFPTQQDSKNKTLLYSELTQKTSWK